MKITFSIALVLCVFAVSNTANARSWWDQAKEILNSDTGSAVVKSLGGKSNLTNGEISAGLRDALRIGTTQVVKRLGTKNGFNQDPKIHIPLPDTLARVDKALSAIGMNSLTENLELRLNRAAEIATPKAKELFITAISKMTINDAKNILTGSENAATQYLRKTMGSDLSQEMQPIVDKALESAGAIQAYNQVMSKYSHIPFVPDVKANLKSYVVEKAMDGIFFYVGQEEAAIRKNPAKRTTDLLKKVFSSQ